MTPPQKKDATRLDQATVLVLVAALVLGLCVLPDYGATSDEAMRAQHGESWLQYFTTFDRRHLPQGHFAYYGALFDILGAALHRLHARLGGTDDLLARHLMVLLAGWLGLVGAYKLSSRLGPQPLPLFAVLLLLLLPRYVGACFSYPKDIPFAAAFTWAVWGLLRWLEAPDERSALRFGLCTAVCTAVRPFGAAFLVLGVFAWLWRRLVPVERAPAQAQALFLYLLFGVGASALLWPTSWFHPPGHAIEGALALLQHSDGTPTLLFGETYAFSDTPPIYVAAWLGATLPLPTLALALFGLVSLTHGALASRGAWRARLLHLHPALLLGGWAFGPPLVPFLHRVVLYHTTRQLLFLLPAFAILAAVGLHRALRTRRRALLLGIAAVASAAYLDVALDMVRLHPYQSVYFSRIVGRVPGAVGRFTISYNGETYREAMRGLAQVAGGPARVLVHEGYISISVPRRYAREHGHVLNPPDFDYFMTETYGEATRFPGEIIHRVRRLGVDLSVIVRVAPLREQRFTWAPRRGPLLLQVQSPRQQQVDLHLGYTGQLGLRVNDEPLVQLRAHHHPGAPAQERLPLRLPEGTSRLLLYGDERGGELRLHHAAAAGLEISQPAEQERAAPAAPWATPPGDNTGSPAGTGSPRR